MTAMNQKRILLDHGSGGRLSNRLIAEIIMPAFDNPELSRADDCALLGIKGSRVAFSTDSYVVDPLFFPGGDIGELAVNGTVNDIAMGGARPLFLSAALIIEEGFAVDDLGRIIESMAAAARKAGVRIVTGDTKVVPAGAADKIYINTSGIGEIPEDVDTSAGNARAGDIVIISGSIADHGITILSQREGLAFDHSIKSDTAPLNHMVNRMIDVTKEIHVLRDPTRGGVATALNEIAGNSNVGIRLTESRLPIDAAVAGMCELLGLDPLHVANEGKLLAFVAPDHAADVLSAMQSDEYGSKARVIGRVVDDHPGRVILETDIGGERIVDMLTGEQLPRIC